MKLGQEYLITVKPQSLDQAKSFLKTFFPEQVFIDDGYYYGVKDMDDNEICICSEEYALTEEQYEKGVWLSFTSSSFDAVVPKLKAFGVREVKGGDKHAFFFSFPGGPVIKLIKEA